MAWYHDSKNVQLSKHCTLVASLCMHTGQCSPPPPPPPRSRFLNIHEKSDRSFKIPRSGNRVWPNTASYRKALLALSNAVCMSTHCCSLPKSLVKRRIWCRRNTIHLLIFADSNAAGIIMTSSKTGSHSLHGRTRRRFGLARRPTCSQSVAFATQNI